MLRNKFIAEDCVPKGACFIPTGEHENLQHNDNELRRAVGKARQSILNPETSCVVVQRHYPGLSEIANRVFDLKKHHSDLYPLHKAREFPVFRNQAGRDFITVVKEFSRDQDFPEAELTYTRAAATGSHIDLLQQQSASQNIQRGYLGGGIIVTQALSCFGTGVYDHDLLERAGISPELLESGEWHYQVKSAEAAGVEAQYARPGDIMILRQGNWGEARPPSVHTWPATSAEDKRLAYCAMGYAKPVVG